MHEDAVAIHCFTVCIAQGNLKMAIIFDVTERLRLAAYRYRVTDETAHNFLILLVNYQALAHAQS